MTGVGSEYKKYMAILESKVSFQPCPLTNSKTHPMEHFRIRTAHKPRFGFIISLLITSAHGHVEGCPGDVEPEIR